MNESLPLRYLSPFATILRDRCAFLYGASDSFINDRLQQIRDLRVKGGMDSSVAMLYKRSERAIVVNRTYAKKNSNGENVSFSDEKDMFFRYCLIHEMLHAISHHDDFIGFAEKSGHYYVDGTGLNEGVTQMFTDDVMGGVENKFIASYNELKIITKLIRNTVGNRLLFRAYTEDANILRDELTNISKNPELYKTLNEKMTAFNTLFIKVYTTKATSNTAKALYYQKFEKLLEFVVLNIVVPYAKSLDEDRRMRYIRRIIYDTAEDDKAKNLLKNVISKYINLDSGKLKDEKTKHEEEFADLDEHIKFINLMDDGESIKGKVYAKDNGDVYILGSNNKSRKVTSLQELRYIYTKLFELNGLNKQMTPEVIESYKKYIVSGKPLTINRDSVLKRRIIYCGIVSALAQNDVFIMNSFIELDNKNTIQPDFINTRNLKFNDLRKVAEHYYIGKDGYSYSIFDRRTRTKEENPSLSLIAFFAINWLSSAGDKMVSGESVKGITDAYSPEKEKMYTHITDVIGKVSTQNNAFDIKAVEASLTPEEKIIVRRMFADPTRFEWAYEFLRRGTIITKDYVHKGKSFSELENGDYIQNRSHNDMLDVMSM